MSDVVYFIKSGSAIKIGVAANVRERMKGLSTSSPKPLKLLATIPGSTGLERALHRLLKEFRLRGEWFRDCPEVRAAMASPPEIPLNQRKERDLGEYVPTPPIDKSPVSLMPPIFRAFSDYTQSIEGALGRGEINLVRGQKAMDFLHEMHAVVSSHFEGFYGGYLDSIRAEVSREKPIFETKSLVGAVALARRIAPWLNV